MEYDPEVIINIESFRDFNIVKWIRKNTVIELKRFTSWEEVEICFDLLNETRDIEIHFLWGEYGTVCLSMKEFKKRYHLWPKLPVERSC